MRKTSRQSPQGYTAVDRPLAKHLHVQGQEVTVCGNNVNMFHVFDRWRLGVSIQTGEDFDKITKEYQYYHSELCRYPVFYVPNDAYCAWEKGLIR